MALLAQGSRHLLRVVGGPRSARESGMRPTPALGRSMTPGSPTPQAPAAGARVFAQAEQLRHFADAPAAPAGKWGAAAGARAAVRHAQPPHTTAQLPPPRSAEDEDLVLSAFRQQQQQYQALMKGLQVRRRALDGPAGGGAVGSAVGVEHGAEWPNTGCKCVRCQSRTPRSAATVCMIIFQSPPGAGVRGLLPRQ